MLERAVDDADREHQIPGGAVLLFPLAAQEPVDQVVDGDGLGQRRLPQPVRLEVDPAQLINDHRADLRCPDGFFVLFFGIFRLEDFAIAVHDGLDVRAPDGSPREA